MPSALNDLQRLRDFIRENNPEAARKAAFTVRKVAASLEKFPYIGKEVENLPSFYDIIIPFGAGSYLLRYTIQMIEQQPILYIIMLRHSIEAGFSTE